MQEPTVDPDQVLALADETTMAVGPDGALTLSGRRGPLVYRRLSAGLREALTRLAGAGERAGSLAEHVRAVDGPGALARWFFELQNLAGRGLLRLAARVGSDRLATLEPTAATFVLAAAGLPVGQRWVLSRFAWLQRRGDFLALESPLAPARVLLEDTRAVGVVHALARPGTAAEVADRSGLPAEALRPLLGLFVQAGAICAVGADGPAEDADPALRCWQFHDLLFHARSREGRHDGPLGATYPQAGRLEPPPACPPGNTGADLALFVPDLERLGRQDPPYAAVQEGRCSVRRYGSEPITDRQLGEFLYRVARVRGRQRLEVDTPVGPVSMDFAARPYPAGGALYELEVYAVVQKCHGLGPGVYRYDGVRHHLTPCPGESAAGARLLADAARSAGLDSARLQVLLILAARLPRLAWKYEGLAYALVLKHVGVVYQTMYLAATAMGLAPCALGSGNADLFARAVGVDYYGETSVGEFLLGSRPEEATG